MVNRNDDKLKKTEVYDSFSSLSKTVENRTVHTINIYQYYNEKIFEIAQIHSEKKAPQKNKIGVEPFKIGII